jgi:hypothetical protein
MISGLRCQRCQGLPATRAAIESMLCDLIIILKKEKEFLRLIQQQLLLEAIK